MEREIRIHIGLDHENIVKLYAAFEDEKNVYMVRFTVMRCAATLHCATLHCAVLCRLT